MRNQFSFVLALGLAVFIAGAAGAQSSPAPAAGSSPAAGSAPLATADGEVPGTQVQVTKLKRTGDSVLLQFTIFNNSDADVGLTNLSTPIEYKAADAVYLADLAGKKKYEVVRDTDKKCLCSKGLEKVQAKSSVNLWAKFPAPPDSVQKLSVVIPHYMPIDDVPVSQ
jgi:hypothetical protein